MSEKDVVPITFSINGRNHALAIDPDTPLLWVLREEMRLTGTKYSCGQGVCGACTVLLDGRPVRSCVIPIRQAMGREILTIEGIAPEHPVKQAWERRQVPQCGYCQPGFILQTIGLLQNRPQATLPELLAGLNRHLCRCGTYPRMKPALEDLVTGRQYEALPAWGPHFSAAPVLGPGFGLVLLPTDGGYSLAAVSRRSTALDPPVWLWLTPDNLVTVILSKTEMGQGVFTSLAMAVAEELDLPGELLRLEAAPAAAGYRDPVWWRQLTGGSTSTSHLHGVFQRLGATAREMLVVAAAAPWQVAAADCEVHHGLVRHRPTGRQASYGELCLAASTLPVPANPQRRQTDAPRYVGTGQPRPDIPLKINGAALFGLDYFTDSMLYAVIARPPALGAEIISAQTEAAAAFPGVRRIMPLDHSLAVLADSPAQALHGRQRLEISWGPGSRPELDDAGLEALFLEQVGQTGVIALETGDVEPTLGQCSRLHTAEYLLPYLAHAPLEPTNCLADVRPDRCEIWAPLQNQTLALEAVQQLTGLPPDKILIHTAFVGGGFGRRLEVDNVMEAVRLSQTAGRPVKLFWTRDDDFRHDFFRPMTATRLMAGLNEQGRVLVWDHTIAAPSIYARTYPQALKKGIDPAAAEGLRPPSYTIPHYRLRYVRVDTPVPVGPWRSVGHSHNAFVLESAMDELAHLAGADPLEFRLAHLPAASRAARVLALAGEKAGWGKPSPSGRARGIAQHASFGSFVAQVAEVSVDETSGRLTIHRVVCAVDCGTVVNPDTVAAQMEGGILFGLSAALHEQVHFVRGGVATENFTQYPLLTLAETPAVEVHIIASGDPPGGVGEPGVPPIAPAVANAFFAATGRRVRRLPLQSAGK